MLGLVWMVARRRNRLLGRMELLSLVALAALTAVAALPGLVDVLPRLTGFTGELRRITSLLVFAVVMLVGWNSLLASQLGELSHKLHRTLRAIAVDAAVAAHPPGPAPEIAVVLPAYNEADNLPLVLGRAPAEVLGRSVGIVVVDDGSSDGTAEVARAHGAWVVVNPINAGGGHALQVGFEAARRLGARWVVTMDADGQHRFEDLPAVVAPLVEGRGQVVIGSRHLGASVGHEAVRALGLKVFNALLSFLVGRPITDCSSGYRGFDLGALGALTLVQQRHHTAEMIIEASRRGLALCEVPITILPRAHGVSKKGTNWLYGLRFANTILSTWWRR